MGECFALVDHEGRSWFLEEYVIMNHDQGVHTPYKHLGHVIFGHFHVKDSTCRDEDLMHVKDELGVMTQRIDSMDGNIMT
jgi:hypothetical protein